MKSFLTPVLVVAAALIGEDGRILMQKRRSGAEHGGLWEFPGGKVEGGETPENALIREIAEELGLGLAAADLQALTFASNGGDGESRPLVILLYICRKWTAEPRCLDGEAIAWFEPRDLAGLEMPPLDYPLARALISSI